MRAFVIVDLGFGDAGKGLLTDFLVRETGARLVVRYNGGAQAGHNVVTTDGRHHTFSQFGSGTFVPGVRTFLSRNVVVHPTALLRENARLASIGITDALERIRISGDALVITPYHQELNRMRERARGTARHGSCGVGVGETVGHALAFPEDAIRMRDLGDVPRLRRKLARIRDYAQLDLDDEAWIETARTTATLVADDFEKSGVVIFEGAQGVLLDERHGFPPHTTWSDCTVAPALALLPNGADVRTIGVLRTFAVRHGAGPLPSECDLPHAPAEHNTTNEWQGAVRRGWFDAPLARYALDVAGTIDALAITHLDWLRHLTRWTYADGSLHHTSAREEDVIERIEALTGKRVAIGSRGPTAADVYVRCSWTNGRDVSSRSPIVTNDRNRSTSAATRPV